MAKFSQALFNTIRTRIAVLLLRAAGRVIDVPCDVELARDH